MVPSQGVMTTGSEGVDDYEGPDPTANVIATIEARDRRQDDLREAEARHVRELLSARDSLFALRAEYDALLREAESKRIDAIRAVDVGAVNRAAEVSATQATTLAAQVATSAETLRTQVAAAATAAATALGAALEPLNTAIADLRRAQYEAQGQKTQVTEARQSNGAVLTAIGLGITVIFLLLALAGFVLTNTK